MTEQQIRKLIEKLNRASDAYYNTGIEIMPNYEWDAGFDTIKAWEKETGIIFPDSPTQRVSADDVPGQKETHEFPALSLAKTKDVNALVKWADGRDVWLSYKLDGSTLVATYNQGKLERLLTRGNGTVGTNITHLAPAIQGVPLTIDTNTKLVVRGEVLITLKDFEEILENTDEDYKNARNLAAGSLTLKDIETVKERHLRWVVFTPVYIEGEPEGFDMNSWGARMNYLSSLGFDVVPHELYHPNSLPDGVAKFTERVESGDIPYPVDGLVIAYDDWAYSQSGNVTGHHSVRGGFAFKWQDKPAETTLQHIEWSCAAGSISPVAVFDPVELEGTTVRRANLFNISECRRLGIAGPGTKLKVIKANMIIPMVVEASGIGSLDIPQVCPSCHEPTDIRVSPSGAETLHCSNPECPAKQIKRFVRFVSKDGMDIDGMSEQTVKAFIAAAFIGAYPDIYHLSSLEREMKDMDGFGEVSVNNLLASIEKSRNVSFPKFMYSLCIPMCGHDVCKKISAKYTFQDFLETVTQAALRDHYEVFAHIEGIGPEKSSAIVSWFENYKNRLIVDKLVTELTIADVEQIEQGNKCKGLTFVITGDVHIYKNRSELKSYIESQGGKCTGSVTRKTSFLINNDVTSTSGKNQKAQELGIPIISEDEFVARYSN